MFDVNQKLFLADDRTKIILISIELCTFELLYVFYRTGGILSALEYFVW